MQTVGQLVRLRANQRRLRLVDGLPELIGVHAGKLLGEYFDQLRENVVDKGAGAANDIFKEPALALMDAHGNRVAHCGAFIFRADIHLINGMVRLRG